MNELKDTYYLYVYGKKKDNCYTQEFIIDSFLESEGKKIKKVYKDTWKNNLSQKPNLNRLLVEHNNIDIVIYSLDILSYRVKDIVNIYDLCREKNIRIYIFNKKKFLNDYLKCLVRL